MDYTRINIFEMQEMDLDIYLYYMREAFIYENMQSKEGKEYLENCWRMTQTKPDRKALRARHKK